MKRKFKRAEWDDKKMKEKNATKLGMVSGSESYNKNNKEMKDISFITLLLPDGLSKTTTTDHTILLNTQLGGLRSDISEFKRNTVDGDTNISSYNYQLPFNSMSPWLTHNPAHPVHPAWQSIKSRSCWIED